MHKANKANSEAGTLNDSWAPTLNPQIDLKVKNPYLSYNSKNDESPYDIKPLFPQSVTSKGESDGANGNKALNARFTFGDLATNQVASLSRTGNFNRPSDITE